MRGTLGHDRAQTVIRGYQLRAVNGHPHTRLFFKPEAFRLTDWRTFRLPNSEYARVRACGWGKRCFRPARGNCDPAHVHLYGYRRVGRGRRVRRRYRLRGSLRHVKGSAAANQQGRCYPADRECKQAQSVPLEGHSGIPPFRFGGQCAILQGA